MLEANDKKPPALPGLQPNNVVEKTRSSKGANSKIWW